MSDPGARVPRPVTADGDNGHALGSRAVFNPVDMFQRKIMDHADQLVLHLGKPGGAEQAATVFIQFFLDLCARGLDGFLQDGEYLAAYLEDWIRRRPDR